MAAMYRGDECVLYALGPHIKEKDIGHIHLCYLENGEGDGTHQQKGDHRLIYHQKSSEKADGEQVDQGPEEQLKEGEYVPLGDHPVLVGGGQILVQFTLPAQGTRPPDRALLY